MTVEELAWKITGNLIIHSQEVVDARSGRPPADAKDRSGSGAGPFPIKFSCLGGPVLAQGNGRVRHVTSFCFPGHNYVFFSNENSLKYSWPTVLHQFQVYNTVI